MTDEAHSDEDVHAHTARAAEVDRIVTQAMEACRAVGVHEKTVFIGAVAAVARFSINMLSRNGVFPTVRGVMAATLPVLNKAAEAITLAGPAKP